MEVIDVDAQSDSSMLSSVPSTSYSIKNPTASSRNPFFVLPPALPPSMKGSYRILPNSVLTSSSGRTVEDVVGEMQEAGQLYYFVRCPDAIHKFSSEMFEKEYSDLIEDYRQKKEARNLPSFDPSSDAVHVLSRVRLMLTLRRRSAARKVPRPSRGMKYPLRSISTSTADDEADEGYGEESHPESEDSEYGVRSQRAARSQSRKSPLPFSPRKTRSRHIHVMDSDQDEPEQPQRFSRRLKHVKVRLTVESNDEANVDDGIGSDSDHPSHKRITKVVRKDSCPAYGKVQSIAASYCDWVGDGRESLRSHRAICEKCHRRPAHELLEKLRKGKWKHREESPSDQSSDEEDRLKDLGGWVRCLRCPVSAHWQCLATTQRDGILRSIRAREHILQLRSQAEGGVSGVEPLTRRGLNIDELTEFVCGSCMKGATCLGCMEIAIKPWQETFEPAVEFQSALPAEKSPEPDNSTYFKTQSELLFRCLTCKRTAHYEHLRDPESREPVFTVLDKAKFYSKQWLCADCLSYRYSVDKILAWRPYPPNAVESNSQKPDAKTPLPREYLVKWSERSYRRVQWVPHMWLLSTHRAKLKNFLSGQIQVDLLSHPTGRKRHNIDDAPHLFNEDEGSRDTSAKHEDASSASGTALIDAEDRIPQDWKTVDRVLDVYLWHPLRFVTGKRENKRPHQGENDNAKLYEAAIEKARALAIGQGEQPSDDLIERIEVWESRECKEFTIDRCDLIIWAFIKWRELGYDEATWDSPPSPDEPGYEEFKLAVQHFIDARQVTIPLHNKKYFETFDKRVRDDYRNKHVLKDPAELDLGQDAQLKLMPFQVDGFNWLSNNWWTHQNCILADEMGLGKTVQMVTFLGRLVMKFNAYPALVVVPNSTIANWIREFERWAPKLRAVPFYGDAKARDVVKRFELMHNSKPKGTTGHKYHVLVTTYEALLNPKDFSPVFKAQPRWEVLVVDEGQRLKNDSSLLFKRLKELNSRHRIIMTGTPLNNNIRELFNLMSFLDPNEWHDLKQLEKDHEELTEDLIKQLHTRLRPYFLRRLKSEVLQLPPKNEVIVPISMTSLQKEVYRSILSHNLEILNGLTKSTNLRANNSAPKGRVNNLLMQLRKCLQHPYLYSPEIEPRGLSNRENHEKLIDASAKLCLLKILLPKLKERGHRVLLFSQFALALDILEDFLHGEGYNYLRMDGSTKGTERQKAMDEFNRPGSDMFIFILTTRAGGVGINLYTADTVIIFDPDFNPHQDLQAISRAYRYGQTRTCLVFKLMVKNSAEERIMQVGKKKLALDHLIVQKMDDDESGGDDIKSILTFGAQALFDDANESKDITYTESDIQALVEKTEEKGEGPTPEKEAGFSFSFAKVWAAEKDVLEDVGDTDPGDSWAETLQKITTEREKDKQHEIAVSGRGVRRKAALHKLNAYVEESQVEPTKKKAQYSSDDSAYASPSESEMTDRGSQADAESQRPKHEDAEIFDERINCGLCGEAHDTGPGRCFMTDKSENLADFRQMLLLHADDEPLDQRVAAVQLIDKTLNERGDMHLVAGQPLYPVDRRKPFSAVDGRGVNSRAIPSAPGAQKSPLVHTEGTGFHKRPAPTDKIAVDLSKRPRLDS